MNYKIQFITERQQELVLPSGERLALPADCYAASEVQSDSGNIVVIVIYQNDCKIHHASNYYGVLCVKNNPNRFSFHLGRMEMAIHENEAFIWKVLAISDDMVATFEVARKSLRADGFDVKYIAEKWQLKEAKSALKKCS